MRLTCLVFVLLLSACTTPPTKQELATADYGNLITEQEAQTIAQTFLNGYLK